MYDPLDVSLTDGAMLEEVGLMVDLIIAASRSAGRLTPDEIDRTLQVDG
jgi:hypothetical protein